MKHCQFQSLTLKIVGVSELGVIVGFLIFKMIGIGKSTPAKTASLEAKIGKNSMHFLLLLNKRTL
ncbi:MULTISPECIES: hypothetical protein [Emticicia]|uniref:hypothetical protein n=1 Tax=Emticicia TaxID=312278 RepID=UPI0007D89C28|nr:MULTISPECIES: hypothetical protein [Emticicia]